MKGLSAAACGVVIAACTVGSAPVAVQSTPAATSTTPATTSAQVTKAGPSLALQITDLPNSGAVLGVAAPAHTLDTYIAYCCGGFAENKSAWSQAGFDSWYAIDFDYFNRSDPRATHVRSVVVVFRDPSGAAFDFENARKNASLAPSVKQLALANGVGEESVAFLEVPATGVEQYIVYFRYRNTSHRVFLAGRTGIPSLAAVTDLAKKQLSIQK